VTGRVSFGKRSRSRWTPGVFKNTFALTISNTGGGRRGT
jgi:hypothetical protein